MQQDQRHNPLVAWFLSVVSRIGAQRLGITPGLARAADLRIDGAWNVGGWHPSAGRGNGSARVQRAALKRRNVLRNRRNHK